MPVSLSNSKDIVANSVSLIKGNRVIDVLETIDAVQGLAPETLNSLEKLANALNNDSNYFQTVSGAISNKADKATTYTKTEMDNNIGDLEEIVMTELDEKQDTLTAGTVSGGYSIMQNGIVRALKAVSPAWPAPDVNHMEFGVDLSNYATNAAVALKANQSTTYTNGS